MTNAAGNRRDHGGGIDAMIARYGGDRADWLDLSTGINPVPYALPGLPDDAWTALPDQAAMDAFETAAREIWNVPDEAGFLAAPGASSVIARIPALHVPARFAVRTDTYNEHAAAFSHAGWRLGDLDKAHAQVIVHPNNPTGELTPVTEIAEHCALVVIDESFCDTTPIYSLIHRAGPGVLVLKSIGKFWGLAGLRLGAVMGDPDMIARLKEMLGPWPVSGPALTIGTQALRDAAWAEETRARLSEDADWLDSQMTAHGASVVGGTELFRLYHVNDAARWQHQLAELNVLTRAFPYNANWLRLGLPHPNRRAQLTFALQAADLG